MSAKVSFPSEASTPGKRYLRICFFSLLSLLTIACKEKADEITPDTKSRQITDLPGDTEASVGGDTGNRPFYPLIFNLSDGTYHLLKTKEDSAKYLKTNLWDLAFTGIYNSDIYINNGKKKGNPGYGGPTEGTAIVMIEKNYDQVEQAPSDETFTGSTIDKIGWSSGPGSTGWFYYSLDNHISVPIKNRTFVLRLANGKYAKLEIQNIYKNNPPVVTDLYWPAPYLSFRYYLQEDGSKNLATR